MKPRTIVINGSAGAYTTILATQWCWRAEIIEDFSANAGTGQGLQYLIPDPTSVDLSNPNWLGPFSIAPQTEPIILGEPLPMGGGFAPTIGHGPDASGGYTLAATPLIQIRSATATGTTVRCTEFP